MITRLLGYAIRIEFSDLRFIQISCEVIKNLLSD